MLLYVLSILGVIQSGYSQDAVSIERISNERGIIPESPIWDDDAQALYWLDIRGQTVHKYADGEESVVTFTEGMISGIVPVERNPDYFIVGIETVLYLMHWTGDKNATLQEYAKIDLDKPSNRVNDGKCDSKGRYWIGTMGPQDYTDGAVEELQGTLYMVDKKNHDSPAVKISPVSISNGLAWSRDNSRFFYIDSETRLIDVYQFNSRTSKLGKHKVLFDLVAAGYPGIPDGMTIDENDNLWVAIYDGGVVLHIDSETGELISSLEMPTMQVSSAIWGGPNLDILYVTTGSQYLTDEELEADPDAGHVFAVTGLGVKGLKSEKYDVGRRLRF